MRTVIYARKSTESDDRQIQSLDDQIRELRSLAAREGLRVSEVFQESKSAKEPGKRPEFARLVADVEAGKVDVLLTWSITRLSRNPVDGGLVAYLLQTGKLSLIRTPEHHYRPEDNALLLSVENGMATAYIQDLRRNVIRGMKGKAERGWHACKAPVGYLNDADSRDIRVDPERYPLVREGWDMLLSGGYRVSEIHRHLVAKGLTVRSRHGVPGYISPSRVYEIFRCRFYCGEVALKDATFGGRHQPMVTEEEFRRAQDLIARPGKKKKPAGRALPFGGVFRCAACGCAIVGEVRHKTYPRTGRSVTYTYYHCSGSRGCTKRSVRQDDLVEAAERLVSGIRLTRKTADWLSEAVAQSFERVSVDSAATAGELERRVRNEEIRLRRLAAMRLDAEIGSAEYADMRAEILGRQADAREGLDRERDAVGNAMRHLSSRLDACLAAGEIQNLDHDPAVLAEVLRLAGNTTLNLFPFAYRLDPILEKIAAFEPLRDSSEKPEHGDSPTLFPIWWRLVEDLRNLSTEGVKFADERKAAQTYQDQRWDRENGWA